MPRGSTDQPLISVVAAARPNFMKVAPVLRALAGRAQIQFVHTGQHYDKAMSGDFFQDLGLPAPDVNLGVGSGTHGEQTAAVLVAYEQLLLSTKPDAVVVVGDVNSTLASSLAAAKLNIPVAHVEAGLRSHDWGMPEELNRVVTDRISRWLLTPSSDADDNLAREGIARDRIHLVGNVMVDTLLSNVERARERIPDLMRRLGVDEYVLLTLHRPSNVDDPAGLGSMLRAVSDAAGSVPVLFPVHPRTRAHLDGSLPAQVIATEPFGYIDFLALQDAARVVFTDSGGVQEETSVLGVPCLTLRTTTERPITCEYGTNVLVGTAPDAIRAAGRKAMAAGRAVTQIPYWDGRAGERVAEVLLNDLPS